DGGQAGRLGPASSEDGHPGGGEEAQPRQEGQHSPAVGPGEIGVVGGQYDGHVGGQGTFEPKRRGDRGGGDEQTRSHQQDAPETVLRAQQRDQQRQRVEGIGGPGSERQPQQQTG